MRENRTKHWRILLFAILMIGLLGGCGNQEPIEVIRPEATLTPEVPETPTLTSTPETSAQFDEFTKELFLSEIVMNTINLHYTLAYPENFGITEYEVTLGDADYESMKLSYTALREIKAELETFSYEKLTQEQQFTYDILMDYIDTELEVEDLLLYTEFLSPTTGYQSQLPVLLAEYTFRRTQDVEDYLELLTLVDDTFADILSFERRKSEAGLFMSDETADAIIDQCMQFIATPEENYMIEVFDSKIAELEGLSEAERQVYSERNKELVTTEIVAAYRMLIDGLTELKGAGVNDKGLCYYEDGTEYYEYLVYVETGSGKSVAELASDITTWIYDSIMETQTVAAQDPGVMEAWDEYEFCETEPEKIMKDLTEKIAEIFPELPDVNYTIKYVHPSMQEHMSPAFYLTPPVDDYTNNIIYVNEAYSSSDLYTTMAHEGFPGHLYQNVYTASRELPLVRNLFAYSGYSEGWATYVEFMSYDWGGLEENLAKVLKSNAVAILGIHAGVDIGVNYYGWGVENVEEFLNAYGIGSPENAAFMFDYVVAEPAAYLSYFVGYMEFENLRKTAEEAWGTDYSDTRFYDVVLSLGPAPFPLLEQEIISME